MLQVNAGPPLPVEAEKKKKRKKKKTDKRALSFGDEEEVSLTNQICSTPVLVCYVV